ncbi:nAD+ synthetase [Pelomyxa schiedti]|nr:nAD+ synthetase [Pelomyxa schiedti]
MKEFARVAVCVPPCVVGGFTQNADEVISLMKSATSQEVGVAVFPELCLCSYTLRDLFFDRTQLDCCYAALARILAVSKELLLTPLTFIGMPLETHQGLYNVAVAIQNGEILGVIPKSFIPSYREFEERRWFRPGTEISRGSTTFLLGKQVPFGTDLLFVGNPLRSLVVAAEICEDIWVQMPPSMRMVGNGATVICNLSASNFTIGKADLRRLLCKSASDRGKCAYLYVAAGPGESSTDLAFDADAFICENGAILAESRRFSREPQIICSDIDLELLAHDRRVTGTFGDCAVHEASLVTMQLQHMQRGAVREIVFQATHPNIGMMRKIEPHPFIPQDPQTLATRTWEIFEIQTNALATRMRACGKPKLVLGVSGGLDSTQAALVAAVALDLNKQPRSDLVCITMPGLGTTSVTKNNAVALTESLGGTLMTIPISEASRIVLTSIGHPATHGANTLDEFLAILRNDPKLANVTLENVQARMRTLVLMSVANQVNGLVVGTGDLSEKALGWCTYSGDHIANYDVNCGVPKTLIQFVIRWVANERVTQWGDDPTKGNATLLRQTLFSILNTPISPELVPPDAHGRIAQLTESSIGPYELHDFFLYHFVRHGRGPQRILDLARIAFGTRYTVDELKKWLTIFITRFFRNQFKRSCATDGPKVGMVALSPRGDWRMPSDASCDDWIHQIKTYTE